LQGDLVCECELVTRAMIEQAAASNPTVTLDDLRRDVRLGMGPCQGGFCTFRAAGILHELRMRAPESAPTGNNDGPAWEVAYMQSPRHNTNSAPAMLNPAHSPLDNPNLLLRDFLQERWRGLTPVLWGRQLKQERLDELIYLDIMNIDHLPPAASTGEAGVSPLTEFWQFDTTPGAGSES
jgi:glycerol-3-phosphate dehydrogenase